MEKRQKQKHFKIFVGMQNAPFLSAIAGDVKTNKLLKKFSSKIISDKVGGGSCLKVSCDPLSAPFVKTALLEIFTQCFLSIYKYNFLSERITMPSLKTDERSSLLKALTYFDINIDRQLIFNALKGYDGELFVESFLKFNLGSLEKRWNELAGLVSGNSACFTASETFHELLKFLIANLQPETDEVVLSVKNGAITLKSKDDEQVFSGEGNDLSIVVALISMLPKKIRIAPGKDEAGASAISLVCKLFESKICF